MMQPFTTILSYPFAQRAIIAGVLISLCGALLGVNLVLKRFSMLGDGLSHVSFGAAAIALAFGAAPLKVSIPIVIVAAFFLLRINHNGKIRGDAATAIVSSSALAIGVIVATLTTGMNTDISNYMFGSILAVSRSEVVLVAIVCLCVLLMYIIFYNKIFACTFDEVFATATGVNTKFINAIIAMLTAITVVIGMKIMGALLISSIMSFPSLSAMRICKKYKSTVIISALISVLAFAVGIVLSFAFDIPAGSGIVIINLLIFIVLWIIEKIREKS